jgi:hypothetical protein
VGSSIPSVIDNVLKTVTTNLDKDKFGWNLDPYEERQENVDDLINDFNRSQNKKGQVADEPWKLWYISYSYARKTFKRWNWFRACMYPTMGQC